MRTHFEGFSGSENITYSRHALERMQQREVSDRDVRLILEYGSSSPAPNDCRRYALEPSWWWALDRTGALCRLVGWSVIVDCDGTVVTVHPDNGDPERIRWCDIVR